MITQYEAFLQALLAPLGVYDLSETGIGASELHAMGTGLDAAGGLLEYDEGEALCATAVDEGLTRREALFAHRPAAPTTAMRRAAIAALMQIDGDSLTLDAINHTISGCGIPAQAQETDTAGKLRVIFPETAGIPDQFDRIQKIILEIIPCHLETEFYFRYMTWAECEEQCLTWEAVEAAEHTWESFQTAV